MKTLLFLGLLAMCSAKHWKSYKLNFNKFYTSPSEELKRKAVFEANKMWIEEHNKRYEKGEVSFKVAMNEFADLTNDEFQEKYLNIRGTLMAQRSADYSSEDLNSSHVPESLNWAMKGAVTPVHNQGICGACWAFSVAGAIEAQIFKKTGKLIPLSAQQLIDCSKKFGNKGCAGGMPYRAFNYILEHGVQTEESYPYLGVEELCQSNDTNIGTRIKSFAYLNKTEDRENTLKVAVANIGPITACVWSSKSFRFFSGGIFFDNECKNNTNINHAVLVIGYGHEENMDYWLVKNSWGKHWGENGFGKIVRNMGDHCNIASHNVFPII